MNEQILAILNKYGAIIVERYKAAISTQIASGNLERSIVYRVQGSNDEYHIYINLAAYYIYLEQGRRPGKMPPIDAIVKWIRVKKITPYPYRLPSGKSVIPSERSLAFLIARAIGRRGMPAHNYMANTIEDVEGEMIKELCWVIARTITLDVTNILNQK